MLKFLDGYKTYIIGIAALAFNVGGLVLHYMGQPGLDPKVAAEGIMGALGLMGLRHGVAKTETPAG